MFLYIIGILTRAVSEAGVSQITVRRQLEQPRQLRADDAVDGLLDYEAKASRISLLQAPEGIAAVVARTPGSTVSASGMTTTRTNSLLHLPPLLPPTIGGE